MTGIFSQKKALKRHFLIDDGQGYDIQGHKKTFTRFFSLQKGKFSKNSMKSPFQWHSKKDQVITIHLMGIMHFLSSDTWH